jgi:hypothetical protein
MRTSDTLSALAPALVAAQADLANVHRDSKNPHFRSRFASLEAVRDATAGPLAAHGLVIVQGLASDDKGRVVCTTRLLHASGEWMESDFAVQPVKQDPQAYGSAATYARRYALMGMCGIAPTDDDGEAAQGRAAKSRTEPESPQQRQERIQSREEADEAAWRAQVEQIASWDAWRTYTRDHGWPLVPSKERQAKALAYIADNPQKFGP